MRIVFVLPAKLGIDLTFGRVRTAVDLEYAFQSQNDRVMPIRR